MDKLSESRNRINEIDKTMAELFESRMDAVKCVCEYKVKNGIPVEDSARENAVVERNSGFIESDEIRDYYITFIKDTMAVSRAYQHKLMEGMKAAYCGIEGAFAHIAAKRIFPDANTVPYGDFLSAYEAVQDGECECAVLPIENSYAGDVGQVIDILFEGSLYVNGTYDLGVVHNLIGLPQAELSDIKCVVSHPQALTQCHKYIKEHGFLKKTFENTAMAGKYVADAGDKSLAAIGSKKTAEIYGLKVLDHDINSSDRNTTRFAVISRSRNITGKSGNDRFIIMFTVADETGSVAKAINVISDNGFNMQVLRSRPLKDISWQYYFFVEALGDIYSPRGQKMMKELAECCNRLKLVGSFKDTRELSE